MMFTPDMLLLTVPTCEMQPVPSIEETEFDVQVRVTASVSPFQGSGLDCQGPVMILLQEPLGDRDLVDKHTGQTVEIDHFDMPPWALMDYATSVWRLSVSWLGC